MPGIEIKQKSGFCWMKIGTAGKSFKLTLWSFSILIMIGLAYWFYRELPDTAWRLLMMVMIYSVSAILYLNLGVWLHEQLHYLGFSGTDQNHPARVVYFRKHVVLLSGYYHVAGPLRYQIMRRALLGPSLFIILALAAGGIGNFFLPGWWLPLFLTLAVVGILDMTTDLYWYLQIRKIGEKAKYWDKGQELHVVWKQ